MKNACIEWGSRSLIILGITTLLLFPSEEIITDHVFFENTAVDPIVNYFIGLGAGARDFLVANIACLIYVIEHPFDSTKEMVLAAIHLDQTYKAVRDYIVQTIAMHPQLSMAERGRLHLHLLGDVFYTVGWVTIPALSIGKLERVSKIVEKSGAKIRALVLSVSERATRVLPKIDLQQPIGLVEWFAYDQP